jgi:hypothetical protein
VEGWEECEEVLPIELGRSQYEYEKAKGKKDARVGRRGRGMEADADAIESSARIE